MMLTGAGVIATPLHITQLVAAVEDVLLGSMKDQPIEVSHQEDRVGHIWGAEKRKAIVSWMEKMFSNCGKDEMRTYADNIPYFRQTS